MSKEPTLSVYMPVYNAEAYVGTAIRSILEQTFSDFEFLIVDDGSTDGSAEVIESFKDPRIRLIRQENQGCYPARNRAIAEARGRYLANMDADDISLPQRFAKQIEFLEKYPEAVLVGTKTLACDLEDTFRLPQPIGFTYDSNSTIPYSVSWEQLHEEPGFTCATILFRRELVVESGAYDTRLCYSSDVEFIARAATFGAVSCLPEAYYVFRISPTGISSGGSMVQREILSLIRSLGTRKKRGEKRDFTPVEIKRLAELEEVRKSLPSQSIRSRKAFYETRVATILRVNRQYGKAMKHIIKALGHAPEHILTDRKLFSTLLKCGFGLRIDNPHPPKG